MATAAELKERGNSLAEKYSEDELKSALRNALAISDQEERLALQWALKQKTKTTESGYSFTQEQQTEMAKKLPDAIDNDV